MMLWVNLIMDTMGALALGTEPPSKSLLSRLPYKRNASLISRVMWRNIIIQSIFQIALLAYVLVLGAADFGTVEGTTEHFTVVFNVFVFCQIFNEFNARSISDDPNVFRGLFKNIVFVFIFIFTVGSQYLLVEYGGDFVKTTSLTPDQWYKSILLGALSFPVGGLMRMVPVTEDSNDFAQMTEIMQQRMKVLQKTPKEVGSEKALQNNDVHKSTGFSFVFWLVVVAAVPAVVWMQFGDMWTAHFQEFLAQQQQ
jgi:magnesium-transporting ATPase (P-type)